jgi:ppGpp synthetase/RelA/SpoT-type nucleotidyltranferase
MDFPVKYLSSDYVKWHHIREANDIDLPLKLDNLREELQKSATEDLKILHEMFAYFFEYSKNEYKVSKNEDTEYNSPANVDYKETSSILNKLWRNYKDKGKFISFSNIKKEITDLVRTEIVGDTLTSCRFLAERFKVQNIHNPELKAKCETAITSISFEPEMKMASGYFAYHILIHFADEIIIEVQIYSSIIKKWRDLSHNLYKIVRDAPIDPEFGSKEGRLISLGHLFHLAECEIERLQEDFNKISPKSS